MKKLRFWAVCAAFGALTFAVSCGGGAAVENLRVAALEQPTAVDSATPDFSWSMTSAERGASQSSYRIVVAEDKAMNSVVWDSGVVASDESVGILYGSTGTAQKLALRRITSGRSR